MRHFTMTWDRALKISTALLVALLLAVGVGLALAISAVPEAGALERALAVLPLAVFAAILLLVWAFAPRAIVVGGGRILLDRRLVPVAIPLADVRSLELLGPRPLRGALRVGGAAGAFGHYGRYWSKGLGSFRLFATRSEGLVRVDTVRERFLLSPDAPEAFVEAVLGAAPAAVRADGAPPLASGGLRGALKRIGIGVALGVAGLGGVLGGSWAFGPSAIRATDGEVVIERHLAEAIRIPLGPGVTVRRVGAAELGRVWRVGGVAMGDLRYGRWRSTGLGPFRLYAHSWGAPFVIDGAGERIVVIPDDPAAFEAAVSRRPALDARSRIH